MAATTLTLDGERTTGQDVRTQNVTACLAIANIVKSSLGPVGLDKMLVDDIGEMTITNDGATILQQLEVEHPAAKVRFLMPTAPQLQASHTTLSRPLPALHPGSRGAG